MARSKTATNAKKEPGRIKQMVQVFQMTIRNDRAALPLLIACFLAPIVLAVVLSIVFSGDNWIGIILYTITGVLAGVLIFLIVLGRRAERAAYSQIAGQPGAVSAVIQNSLRGGWMGDPMPVEMNPKTQDAIYRLVGKGGVVLIAEGPATRTRRLVDDQRHKVAKVVKNVPVHVLQVGPDAEAVPLHRVTATLRKYKRELRKAEVREVAKRLESLTRDIRSQIPKGMDPTRVRAGRPR